MDVLCPTGMPHGSRELSKSVREISYRGRFKLWPFVKLTKGSSSKRRSLNLLRWLIYLILTKVRERHILQVLNFAIDKN